MHVGVRAGSLHVCPETQPNSDHQPCLVASTFAESRQLFILTYTKPCSCYRAVIPAKRRSQVSLVDRALAKRPGFLCPFLTKTLALRWLYQECLCLSTGKHMEDELWPCSLEHPLWEKKERTFETQMNSIVLVTILNVNYSLISKKRAVSTAFIMEVGEWFSIKICPVASHPICMCANL